MNKKANWLFVCSFVVLITCMSSPLTHASEEPYVVIEDMSEPKLGQPLYSIHTGYSPYAMSGQAWDDQGQPYAVNVLVTEWSMRGAARIGWGDRWTFMASSHVGRLSSVEERTFLTHHEAVRTSESTWGGQLGVQGRLRPGHPLEPKFALTMTFPERVLEAQIAVSLVRDPIVLSGMLGYGKHSDGSEADVVAGVGMNFVANDVINLGLNLRHHIVPGSMLPPTNRLSIGLGYMVDRETARQMNFETAFWSDGDRLMVSFGIGWVGRG